MPQDDFRLSQFNEKRVNMDVNQLLRAVRELQAAVITLSKRG